MAGVEQIRLKEAKDGLRDWKHWGPYLSERQWGTVREDYSPNGDAWNFFTHDQSRSKAYKWGEDGIAGISDDHQHLCFAVAMWNGADAILKERLFGLTNSEGNHGEDVKEYYFYLDSTPTHSYMKYLYKYPQAAFPYEDLVKKNAARSRFEQEYELIDTGVFNDSRYFDVVIEYAKADSHDILIRITAANRGPEDATLHLLPTLWFRNSWWQTKNEAKPELRAVKGLRTALIEANHERLGAYQLRTAGTPELLFTNNESNEARLTGAVNSTPFVKDAFHEYVVHGNKGAVNPQQTGTKAAVHYFVTVKAGGEAVIRLRLTSSTGEAKVFDEAEFESLFEQRIAEADEFYKSIYPPRSTPDDRAIMRQALAGMLWTKQFYYFDLDLWLREHGYNPTGLGRHHRMRNAPWFHMLNAEVISMPDKWEYPWYAAWDLAFHTVALSMVDIDFAKQQLDLMLSETYLHPNGQLPAYEWNFGDVNPPVHAWAAMYVYMTEKSMSGEGDTEFLRSCFRKLLLNFTWWVNRKDRSGRNVFEGGFLGLDNIGVFDRSAPLPEGGYLEQADGTAWMAMFAQSMLSISLELASEDESYEDVAVKFLEHFLWIAGAMDPQGDSAHELWDDQDGFFYDVLCTPEGSCRLRLKSMVGLLPLAAVSIIPPEIAAKYPRLMERAKNFFERRPELAANLHEPDIPGEHGRLMLAVLNRDNLRRVLTRMLDETQFLSDYGIRSISREHLDKPYVFGMDGAKYTVQYEPAESTTGMFGGNSNWRGPVWMPVNALLVRSLLLMYRYYGDSFTIECPTGSGVEKNLFEVAHEIGERLANIFRVDAKGRRAVYGDTEIFQSDPHWKDLLLFYEYFHGDNGAGIGASHQTGWTGVIARFLYLFDTQKATDVLNEGMESLMAIRAVRAAAGD